MKIDSPSFFLPKGTRTTRYKDLRGFHYAHTTQNKKPLVYIKKIHFRQTNLIELRRAGLHANTPNQNQWAITFRYEFIILTPSANRPTFISVGQKYINLFITSAVGCAVLVEWAREHSWLRLAGWFSEFRIGQFQFQLRGQYADLFVYWHFRHAHAGNNLFSQIKYNTCVILISCSQRRLKKKTGSGNKQQPFFERTLHLSVCTEHLSDPTGKNSTHI